MADRLAPHSNLEGLRKEAKRWLKALRAGDPHAVKRLGAIHPVKQTSTLRVVQHALALEYGFISWAALKREVEERELAARSHAERVTLFLEKSANRYNVAPGTSQWNTYEPDRPVRGEVAARLLSRHPEIVRDSIHTAVAAHDVEVVRELLNKDSTLADRPGGPDGWTPLLRLAYTRIPIDALQRNAVEIVTMLLDRGADPNAGWSDSENKFTVLTGVIGGGEGGQSPHPQAEALARLLIARGAEPFDFQALYNTSLDPDSTFWLELLWNESDRRGEANRWTDLAKGLGEKKNINAINYLLGNAVPNHPRRAEWLLNHGADANTPNAYSMQPVIKHAVLAGAREVVDLLVRHGANPPELSQQEAFLASLTEADPAALRQDIERHPEYLKSPHVLFAAIQRRRRDLVELLLDSGASPDLSDHRGFSALHFAVSCNAVDLARLLIARGAKVDPIEHNYNSTPLGHANYNGRLEMIALLVPLSRDIRGLCFCGAIDRLNELLAADRSLASMITRGNETPLFALPDDDERAVDVAELLLSYGADPTVRNRAGLTPAEAARKRGLEEAATAISAAEQ